LPILADSSNAQLAALAKEDLRTNPTAKEREELGNAWWDRAAAANGLAKEQMQRRAYHWYVQAVPEMTSIDQARIEKRIGQLLDQVLTLNNAWDHLDLGQVQVVDVALHIKPQQEVLTKQSYAAGIEINLIVRTEKNNIRIDAFGGGELVFNWDVKPGEMRVHRPDNPAKGQVGTLAVSKPAPTAPKVWHKVRWRISENGMEVAVDGNVVFTEAAKYDLSTKRPVRLWALDSVIEARSFIVRPLP
jgi:hypothetical protein